MEAVETKAGPFIAVECNHPPIIKVIFNAWTVEGASEEFDGAAVSYMTFDEARALVLQLRSIIGGEE